jgi:nucleotide-binding universal stress UspA family protein
MFKHILCPVDGSDCSRRGLAHAIALTLDQGAQLHLLHVVDNGPLVMYMPLTADAFEAARECGREILAQAAAQARRGAVAADVKLIEILTGRAADGIIEAARQLQPDLIVMGTHGRHGLGRLLLGSDASAVVGTVAAPVLLVR